MDFIQYILSPLLVIAGVFSAAIGGLTYFGTSIHNTMTIASVKKSLMTGVFLATAGVSTYAAAAASRDSSETEIIRANVSETSVERGGSNFDASELDRMPQGPSSND